jgi:hypothetical protein
LSEEKKKMSAIRVLVDLQKLPAPDGGGEVVRTYKCARPIRTPIPDIETYFETEREPYQTDQGGEDIMQQHLKYLHRS